MIKDGLSQNSVHALFRDRDGLVWIGTQDGLNSFDGKNFTVYRHDDHDTATISDQFVVAIKEDREGNLWIGTRNGLNCLNKHTGKFRRYYISENEKHTFQAAYFEFYLQADGKVIIPDVNRAVLLDPATGIKTGLPLPGNIPGNLYLMPDYRAFLINERNEVFSSPDIRKNIFISSGKSPASKTPVTVNYITGSADDSFLFFYDRQKQAICRYHRADKKWLNPLPINLPLIHLNAAQEAIFISSPRGICKVRPGESPQLLRNDPGNDNSLPPGNILCRIPTRKAICGRHIR